VLEWARRLRTRGRRPQRSTLAWLLRTNRLSWPRPTGTLDFQWAVAGPLVGQGDGLPERQAQRRPAALQKVACLEPQLLVESAWPRAAREQAPGGWVSARPQVPQASRLQGCLPAQELVHWEQFSDSQGLLQELPPEQGSREWQGPPVWPRVGQVRSEQSA